MKRLCIIVTLIVLSLTIFFTVQNILKYYNYDSVKSNNEFRHAVEDVNNIDDEIKNKSEELEKIKENNKEKVEIYEVWQKELEKIKTFLK